MTEKDRIHDLICELSDEIDDWAKFEELESWEQIPERYLKDFVKKIEEIISRYEEVL